MPRQPVEDQVEPKLQVVHAIVPPGDDLLGHAVEVGELIGGLVRPKHRVVGQAMAGVVEAVGANVTTCRPGDEVFGDGPAGAFAEYAVMRADRIAPKPSNLSFDEAACTPWAVAALQGLRDAGKVKPGHRVLINGASGGVGTWAVQIAKALGAEVTAVCGPRNVEMVRALGADAVIDYTKDDFTLGGARFDLVFDAVGNRSLGDCRRVLVPAGTFVACAGGSSGTAWVLRMLWMRITALFTRQTFAALMTKPNRTDLLFLKGLVEAGQARPVIAGRYTLAETAAALHRVAQGHPSGQLVVGIARDAAAVAP